jgi:hypothetical protein
MKERMLEALVHVGGDCFGRDGNGTYLRFDSVSFSPGTGKCRLYWKGKEVYLVDVGYHGQNDLTLTGIEGRMNVAWFE